MTLLIDPPNAAGHDRLWSHLASDTSYDELHTFAARLGIPVQGFDRDHYDIPSERYDEVVAAGAVPISSRELVDRLTAAGLRRRKPSQLGPKAPGRTLTRPDRLYTGATVAVVATSGPVPDDRLDVGLAVLESWGLEVWAMPHLRGKHSELPYLASSDLRRAADFMAAWCDPEVAAVFLGRGGYGAQRILDMLDWTSMADAGPKLLVGFSDATALHEAIAGRLGLATVLGPVVTSLGGGDERSQAHLREMLFGDEPAALSGTTLIPGAADGPLVGGNLTVLATSVGTEYSRPAAGSIVLLEDTSESVYTVDRYLTQLLRTGWFKDVHGIALGQFTDCGDSGVLASMFLDRLGSLGVPVVANLPFGHEETNLALPLGLPSTLEAGQRSATLKVNGAAVS